jgi:hypothetical protein
MACEAGAGDDKKRDAANQPISYLRSALDKERLEVMWAL